MFTVEREREREHLNLSHGVNLLLNAHDNAFEGSEMLGTKVSCSSYN